MSTKQAVSGFKVRDYQVKKAKDTEKVKLILEADVENLGAGNFDFGEILKALWSHQASETDIGLSVFMDEKILSTTADDVE